MIRLAWSLEVADAPEPAVMLDLLAKADIAGVDLAAADAESALEVGRRWTAARIPVICLATRATLPTRLGNDSTWLDPARHWTMAAAELGAEQLRLHITHDESARSRPSPVRLAEQLAALAGLAEKQGVRIVLETRGELARPADLWRILELSESKNLSACCWFDPLGESQNSSDFVQFSAGNVQTNSISTLNLRIRYVHIRATLREAVHASATSQLAPAASETVSARSPGVLRGASLGGTAPVIRQLRGIGYDGWISLASNASQIGEMAKSIRAIITPPQAKPAPAVVHRK